MYFETILDKPRFRIGVILHPFRVVLAGKILDDPVKAPLKQYFSFTVAASRTSRRCRFYEGALQAIAVWHPAFRCDGPACPAGLVDMQRLLLICYSYTPRQASVRCGRPGQ